MTKRLPAQWDWILGSALIGAAGVVLVITWTGVSGSRFVSDQLSHIVSGGLGGLVLLGLGSVLIVTAGLADEWRKLNRLEDALPFPPGEPRTDAASLVRNGRIVAGLGMGLSVAFLVPTWFTVSGHADPEPGLEAITWAVVGLIIGGLIAGLATLRMQRRIQARKRRLFAPWATPVASAPAMAVQEAAVRAPGHVLVAPELTRFHLPGCLAVTGLATRRIDRREIPTDLEPCDLCEADAVAVVREERTWTSVAG
jgi:hypothetical protein